MSPTCGAKSKPLRQSVDAHRGVQSFPIIWLTDENPCTQSKLG